MVPLLRTAIVVASIALAISARSWPRMFHATRPGRSRSMPWSRPPRSMSATTSPSSSSLPRSGRRNGSSTSTRLPELTSQTEVRSALSPGGRPARELSAVGRPVLFARIPVRGSKGRDGVTVRVEYEANLLRAAARPARAREQGCTRVAPLPQKERRLALAEGRQFDFRSPSFQGWLDAHKLRREPKEGEIDFARRVFLEIKSAFQLSTVASWIGWPRTSARRAVGQRRAVDRLRLRPPRQWHPRAGRERPLGCAIPSPAATRPTSRTSRPSSSRQASAGSRSISAPP